MKAEKKKIADLTLCYWVTTLDIHGRLHFLVASEKEHPCLLFDAHGIQTAKVWDGPGGTMTAVQLPGAEDGAFLATHRMYSPNNCKEASIVFCYPEDGEWKVRTLLSLPGVHRFDVLTRGGRKYLIACTIKSGYEYKDDWRFPGKVYACELPEDLRALPDEHGLPLTVIKDSLTHNHGYSRDVENGVETAVITGDEGVFRFTPPESPAGTWRTEQLISEPTSDALMLDFDGDGEKEMMTFSPFHGDTLKIFKRRDGAFRCVYECEKKLGFIHAICPAQLNGKDFAIIGHRKGDRDLMALSFRGGAYELDVLDHDVGPANARTAQVDGKTVLVSANREINEVAYYTLTED